MAVNPLDAAIPASPMVDDEGRVTPAWRAFFRALLTRTGGTVGLATPDLAVLQSALATETAARQAADISLTTAISTKYAIAGGTIQGSIGFYNHVAHAQPVVIGSRAGNAALTSLLQGLGALGVGLVNDAST